MLFNPYLREYEGISLKLNIIARLEFDLAYYDFTIQHISPYGFSVKNLQHSNFDYDGKGSCRGSLVSYLALNFLWWRVGIILRKKIWLMYPKLFLLGNLQNFK